MFFNPPRSPDEVCSIAIVLWHSRSHSQHVRIKNDIQRIHTDLLCEQTIGTRGNLNTTFESSSLSLFVKAHNYHGSTKALHVTSMIKELCLSFFQGDRVDNALALYTFQSGSDNLPVRGVNHHWYTGDIGFCSNAIQEIHHFCLSIEQTVVHVYIDDEGTVFDLFAGNGKCLFIVLLLNQPQELTRTSHITTFANIDKLHVRRHIKQFQTTQPHRLRTSYWLMRFLPGHQRCIGGNEGLISTATASNDIH